MASFTDIFSEELQKLTNVITESAVEVQRLQEEENKFKNKLNVLREQCSELRKSNAQKESEFHKLEQEDNYFQDQDKYKEELEADCSNLLMKIEPSSGDLRKLKIQRTKCAMYQKLLGLRWDVSKMRDDPQLLSGIIYNKTTNDLKLFSTSTVDSSVNDTIEEMWKEIGNDSDGVKNLLLLRY